MSAGSLEKGVFNKVLYRHRMLCPYVSLLCLLCACLLLWRYLIPRILAFSISGPIPFQARQYERVCMHLQVRPGTPFEGRVCSTFLSGKHREECGILWVLALPRLIVGSPEKKKADGSRGLQRQFQLSLDAPGRRGRLFQEL